MWTLILTSPSRKCLVRGNNPVIFQIKIQRRLASLDSTMLSLVSSVLLELFRTPPQQTLSVPLTHSHSLKHELSYSLSLPPPFLSQPSTPHPLILPPVIVTLPASIPSNPVCGRTCTGNQTHYMLGITTVVYNQYISCGTRCQRRLS